jgi:hypothetical protein
VQAYQHHTCIPRNLWVLLQFLRCLPELSQPSGLLNFSRIDSIEFQACVQPSLRSASPSTLFARTWNVIRFRDGLGGLLYSSNTCHASDRWNRLYFVRRTGKHLIPIKEFN